ncbi:hypothetical protein SDC9_94166 [bioreactor metagenome]|uniref:Uncharacterized protein n=1 Tax=bioreactor metagenome TaxID=1076179 RepID=A0A645A3E1_9ZZZZ
MIFVFGSLSPAFPSFIKEMGLFVNIWNRLKNKTMIKITKNKTLVIIAAVREKPSVSGIEVCNSFNNSKKVSLPITKPLKIPTNNDPKATMIVSANKTNPMCLFPNPRIL